MTADSHSTEDLDLKEQMQPKLNLMNPRTKVGELGLKPVGLTDLEARSVFQN